MLIWIKRTGRVTGPAGTFEMDRFDALKALSPGEWKIEGENFLAYYAGFTRLE